MIQLQSIIKGLETQYELCISNLGDHELDNAMILSQLSVILNKLNQNRQALAGLKSTMKVNRVVNEKFTETISDQEIIQGLSAAARELNRVHQQTDLKDWEEEMERDDSASLKQARQAKEELKQAISLFSGFYHSKLVNLMISKEEMERAFNDRDEEAIKDALYYVEINESNCAYYRTFIGHIHILSKMIDKTYSGDEVLTDAQIKNICDCAGEILAQAGKPTTLYDWQAKIRELEKEDNRLDQKAQLPKDRHEKKRLQWEQEKARKQERLENERLDKMKIEQEAKEQMAREHELHETKRLEKMIIQREAREREAREEVARKQECRDKERRDKEQLEQKAKELREQEEEERLAKELREQAERTRVRKLHEMLAPQAELVKLFREQQQARLEQEKQEQIRQEKIRQEQKMQEELQQRRDQDDRRRRDESQRTRVRRY